MEFNKYQEIARTTAVYKEPKIIYPALGLTGEAGECAEQVKKMLRDDGGKLSDERKENLKKEIGDVLWYLANLSADLGFKLNDIAKANLKKLKDRKKRNVIHGSGSNR